MDISDVTRKMDVDMGLDIRADMGHSTDEYGWTPDEDLTDYSYESKIVKKLRRMIRQAKQEGKDSLMVLLKKALVLQKDREKDERVNKVEPEDHNDFLYGQIVTIGDKVQFDVPVFGLQNDLAFAYYEPDLQLDKNKDSLVFEDMKFLPIVVRRTGHRSWKMDAGE